MQHESHIPTHVGFILDGHRRWAKEQGLPILEGHRQGYKNFKEIGLKTLESGVKYVTAYVWSRENWQRSTEEVAFIMKLLEWVAKHELDDIHTRGVRIRIAGNDDRLSEKILKLIRKAEDHTKNNTNGTLVLCLNYGGHEEIVDATKRIVRSGMNPEEITEETISQNIYVPDVPPVDLIIRSSGEKRLSGFMLWRAAYAELYFIDKKWPDFDETDLSAALEDYANRQRRFGA
ncbi:di-trans,poly-cis-decaprenylcistransferase [bacterium]|nr:di-trans,poly-cis-decaprenylcistransferase [bacterium]